MRLSKTQIKVIKILLSIVGVTYILWRMYKQISSGELVSLYMFSDSRSLIIGVIILLLMPLNWIIESIKWKLVVKPLENISIKISMYGVLSGLAVSMFTPNRVGDFGGRILMLSEGNRLKGILATWISNIAQLVCTLLFGIIGGIYLLKNNVELPNVSFFDDYGLIISVACLVMLLVVYWLIVTKVSVLFKNRRIRQFLAFTKKYNSSILFKLVALSMLRYSIFSTQFYLSLLLFGIDIQVIDAYMSIFLIYVIMLFLPVITLFEFSIRGSVAMMILSFFTKSLTEVAAASLFVWIINLGLPAFFGAILWSKKRES